MHRLVRRALPDVRLCYSGDAVRSTTRPAVTGRWNRIRAVAAWNWPGWWPGCSRCCRRKTRRCRRLRRRRLLCGRRIGETFVRHRRCCAAVAGRPRWPASREVLGLRRRPAALFFWRPSGSGSDAGQGCAVGTVSYCW